MMMNKALLALLAASAAFTCGGAAARDRTDEQGEVRRDMREGNVRSLRDIERALLPRMAGMQYLGPEYDAAAMVYRLKFIRDGRVTFVDVDARSGAVLRQR